MNTRHRIADLLAEWLAHTKAETRAIRTGDWAAFRQSRETKATLQTRLGELVETWRKENPTEATAQPSPFAREVGELIALQTQNTNILLARRKKLEERRRHLEKARINLRRIHNTYAPAKPVKLNSYS